MVASRREAKGGKDESVPAALWTCSQLWTQL